MFFFFTTKWSVVPLKLAFASACPRFGATWHIQGYLSEVVIHKMIYFFLIIKWSVKLGFASASPRFGARGRIQWCATEDQCQRQTTADINLILKVIVNLGEGLKTSHILSCTIFWENSGITSMSNIHRSLINTPNLSNIRSFEMVPTKFRKRLRKKYDLSISQVSISANFRKAGTRWMNNTKAREKAPVVSIHLKN